MEYMHKECRDEIIKIIDEKMKRYEYKMGEVTTDINEGYCRACRELKEELNAEK